MKRINRIIAFVSILCMICVSVSAANLTTEVETNDNKVTIKYFLDSMPTDIEEISSITIKQKGISDLLNYVSVEGSCGKLSKNLTAEKNIVWYSAEPFTVEELDAVDGHLFTVNYVMKNGVFGTKEIEYSTVLFTDNDANKSTDVQYDSIVIDFGGEDNTEPEGGNTDSEKPEGGTEPENPEGGTEPEKPEGGNTGSDNTGGNTGDNTGSNTGSGNTDSGNTDSGNTGNNNGSNTGNNNGNNSGSNTGTNSGSNSNSTGGNLGGGNVGGNVGGGNIGGSVPSVIAPKPEAIPNFKGFSDIPSDNWGYKHAYSLMSKGIVSGDGGEMPSMRPADLITRQEAAKIALLAKGIQPEEGLTLDFKDSDKIASWAYPYIATAVKYGLLNGFEDGTVGADKFITREQMLTILGRAMGWNITAGKSVSFADSDDISAWSMDSIAYAAENGIMNGYDDNTIRPKANITRIETFALVDRCLSGK